MLNITNQKNANQNYEVSPHPDQTGHHQKLPRRNAMEGVEREPSFTVDGNVNWFNHYGHQYVGFLKKY